jgi:hypothetical protein
MGGGIDGGMPNKTHLEFRRACSLRFYIVDQGPDVPRMIDPRGLEDAIGEPLGRGREREEP